MEVSTRQLRAFRLAAQHHNFARAAEALFITPSGLSVLIKELERRVGFRLFDRTTRRVELTPHGKELLAVIQRNLAELDAAIASIGRSAKSRELSLTLGTTPLVAANILPPAMREFQSPWQKAAAGSRRVHGLPQELHRDLGGPRRGAVGQPSRTDDRLAPYGSARDGLLYEVRRWKRLRTRRPGAPVLG